ncbi:MAG: hypothetical protein GF313_05510 [Caldithrix sp.]|nr:hypothetical protein [Caldithrix sp.]
MSHRIKGGLNPEIPNIVVTDSGLGGLDVVAEFLKLLSLSTSLSAINLIYVNAQPHLQVGYNDINAVEVKIKIFDRVLKAINSNFKPQGIYIACNTLSVLYDKTPFAQSVKPNACSIVNLSVQAMKDVLNRHKNTALIIFATETTIQSQWFPDQLQSISDISSAIVLQECPGLAGAIERGPDSEITQTKVNGFVQNAIKRLPSNYTDIIVSYNCTHYPYAHDVFKRAFERRNIQIKQFLNPNQIMADRIRVDMANNQSRTGETVLHMVSQTEIPSEKQKAIGGILQNKSGKTAAMLYNYQYIPYLFPLKDLVEY